ncbi:MULTISPECIES: tripartite tricarboxylate transporter permease [Arthrobacter]|uniref:tripartite tricarboxylate transporter permease n=1 Tax=Arthrobacter TaxID=1663 RepID=UPI000479D1FE|nr:tripartite tricarboxylate transporter permease [Arthrobacter sp. 35/47]
MDALNNLMMGFAEALTFQNLLFALIGCLVGTMLGILPGIGATAGIAILIPLTLNMEPVSAIIMLAAIFYGTAYGGTITSVLLNIPGESESAITCIDGYAMTKKGKAGVALTMAGIGSFFGGIVATIGLALGAQALAGVGLLIGPPEFFALVIVGLSLLVGLVGRSIAAGLISASIGLLIAMVGIDPVAGLPRFTFGSAHLFDGLNFVPVIIGIFGLGELLDNLVAPTLRPKAPRLRDLIPGRTDLRRGGVAMLRGTALGVPIGLVPGITNAISSLLSYSVEKKVGRYRHELGTGAIEGVVGPETANNAHSSASLVPLFALGIPATPAIAVLMGAFLQNGLTPGPLLFTQEPLLVWTIIASFFIGNIILLILNVPLVGLWTRVLAIPHEVLVALIFAFLIIGSYSVSNSVIDVFIMIAFGIVGLIFRRLSIPLAPLVLAVVLGPFLESALRQSLQLSQGSFDIFFTRPITLTLLITAALIFIGSIAASGLKRKALLPADAES